MAVIDGISKEKSILFQNHWASYLQCLHEVFLKVVFSALTVPFRHLPWPSVTSITDLNQQRQLLRRSHDTGINLNDGGQFFALRRHHYWNIFPIFKIVRDELQAFWLNLSLILSKPLVFGL